MLNTLAFIFFFLVIPVLFDYWITRLRSRAWHRGKQDTTYRKVKKRL